MKTTLGHSQSQTHWPAVLPGYQQHSAAVNSWQSALCDPCLGSCFHRHSLSCRFTLLLSRPSTQSYLLRINKGQKSTGSVLRIPSSLLPSLFSPHYPSFWSHLVACGVSVLWPGIEPGQWKPEVLTIRPPGTSPPSLFSSVYFCFPWYPSFPSPPPLFFFTFTILTVSSFLLFFSFILYFLPQHTYFRKSGSTIGQRKM